MVFLCLKMKAVDTFWDVEKSNKWKNGKQSISLLKATLSRRSTDVIMISGRGTSAQRQQRDHAVYCEYAPYARQAWTKRRESNGSDVQWRRSQPKMPPDWGFAK